MEWLLQFMHRLWCLPCGPGTPLVLGLMSRCRKNELHVARSGYRLLTVYRSGSDYKLQLAIVLTLSFL